MNHVHKLSIKEIKDLLENSKVNEEVEITLSQDTRSGVHKLLEQYRKRRQRQQLLQEQWDTMSSNERHLRNQGYSFIAGMDEVGRGPLAGPVVAAAVILPENFYLPGLNDSKKITPQWREDFYQEIIAKAVDYSICFADSEFIDKVNIYQATQKVMRDCIKELNRKPDICLVDGLKVKGLEVEQLPLVGGDGKSISIAAASIVAKVTRDRWMAEASVKYPEYRFHQNAGYGTAEHLEALGKYGPCPLHRKSFGGVKEWFSIHS